MNEQDVKLISPDGGPLKTNGTIEMPAMLIPAFRMSVAYERKVHRKLLFYLTGGLGDVVCAEPSVRYAIENFDADSFTVATKWPELFGHLDVQIIDFNKERKGADEYTDEYYVIPSLFPPNHLHQEFMQPLWMNAVDYASIAMFRQQLPNQSKKLVLKPSTEDFRRVAHYTDMVVVHPGVSWGSKSFPPMFWTKLIWTLIDRGAGVAVIGKSGEKTGTAALSELYNCHRAYDLREKLSVMETTALLHQNQVLITNDSAPLHLAASGTCWIGAIATAKYYEHLWHWRGANAQFGWRMENLSLGGLWETIDTSPCFTGVVDYEGCTSEQMNSWLPDVKDMADWAIYKQMEGVFGG